MTDAPLDQRVSLITLGVRDLARATAFYEALGWRQVDTPDGIVVFDLLGQSLGLYPLEDLARDMGLDVADLGTGAATLACNLRDKAEVADVLRRNAGHPGHVFNLGHGVLPEIDPGVLAHVVDQVHAHPLGG